jgi:hypothetical protein
MLRVISATNRPGRSIAATTRVSPGASVTQQGRQPGPAGRDRSAELVGEDPLRIDTGCGEKRHRGETWAAAGIHVMLLSRGSNVLGSVR